MSVSRLAIVQRAPVMLDRGRTIQAAIESIAEAAANGAQLVIFPETYIPGYPSWIWRLRPGTDGALGAHLHGLLLENSVCLRRGDLQPLLDAARQHKVSVVCGVNERDEASGGGTLYNTVLMIGSDGCLLNKHRKLMPTNPERMVWGFGDGSTLKVVETPVGRLGALICWENFMPLARYALYAQGIDVYIAPTYDHGDGWIGTLQHIAREGCCWVVGSGCALKGEDCRADILPLAALYPDRDEWVNDGDSVLIAPGGRIVAGPLRREVGLLYAEIDTAAVGMARRSLDVVGHTSRPDVFQLRVSGRAQSCAQFS